MDTKKDTTGGGAISLVTGEARPLTEAEEGLEELAFESLPTTQVFIEVSDPAAGQIDAWSGVPGDANTPRI